MAGHKRTRLRNSACLPSSRGCRTCRARRVKCGGQRPICANCFRKDLTCLGYDTQTVQLLDLPVSDDGELGQHVMNTITDEELAIAQRSTSLQRIPTSPMSSTDRLSKQLVDECQRVWRGRLWWLRHVCQQLDESDAPELVAAARALIAGPDDPVNGDASLIGVRSYAQCCSLLHNSPLKYESSLLAILMLSLCEVRKRDISPTYGLHIGALVSIILSDPQTWSHSEVVRCILHFDHVTVAGAALKRGESSPFDNEIWLYQQPPYVGSVGVVPLRKITHEYWIKLPGLVARMRNIRDAPTKDSNSNEAVQIVRALREILWRKDVGAEHSLLGRCSTQRTVADIDRQIIPTSYSFSNALDYDSLITYYATRLILLMGHNIMCRILCEKYGRLPEPLPPVEVERFATERGDLIQAILMCWEEYCRAQSYSIRMLIALTPVWAYFKEREFYHPSIPARELEDWLEAKCNIAGQRWTTISSAENMDAMCDYLTGGPIDKTLAIYRLAP